MIEHSGEIRHRAVAAATVGNILEIYDFIAYGIFAVPISHTFFPVNSDFAALMLTFLTFAAGFLARPLGALVLGRYADSAGRKNALSLTLILMAVGTLILAGCPSYASIGWAAPAIMVAGRLLQGFSAGGEIGGTVAMLVENADSSNRGLYGSFQQMSQGAGVLLAAVIGLVLSSLFTDAQIAGGAWRYAFLVGLLIAPVGWYIRRSIPETPEFEESEHQPLDVWTRNLVTYRSSLFLGVAVMVFWTIATYVSNYFTTYATRELHLSMLESFLGQTAYAVTLIVASPLIGALSDRIGPRKPMLFGAGVCAVLGYPLFWYLGRNPSVQGLILVQSVVSFLLACYAACASRVMADIFPTAFRATGVGLAYAVGVTIFGGFTPLAVTGLIQVTGDKLVVGLYLSCAAIVSLVALILLYSPKRQADALPKTA
ncbi:MFS transporter [Enterovirga sp.]|uniref:MFS transporter n=1 Tax=Enterovirga sp. TaxID=2026350 RepID=UPI002C260A79|nr:MFS transporter [Enterovirga sp.]HMO28108.1 MFS transporter [Enterovirga sp.]